MIPAVVLTFLFAFALGYLLRDKRNGEVVYLPAPDSRVTRWRATHTRDYCVGNLEGCIQAGEVYDLPKPVSDILETAGYVIPVVIHADA